MEGLGIRVTRRGHRNGKELKVPNFLEAGAAADDERVRQVACTRPSRVCARQLPDTNRKAELPSLSSLPTQYERIYNSMSVITMRVRKCTLEEKVLRHTCVLQASWGSQEVSPHAK